MKRRQPQPPRRVNKTAANNPNSPPGFPQLLPFLTIAPVCPAFAADVPPDVQKLHDKLLKAKPNAFAGGNGLIRETAVIIKTADHEKAVNNEHVYLKKVYPGSKADSQALLIKDGRKYDQIQFTSRTGEKHVVFFDITEGFGKMDK